MDLMKLSRRIMNRLSSNVKNNSGKINDNTLKEPNKPISKTNNTKNSSTVWKIIIEHNFEDKWKTKTDTKNMCRKNKFNRIMKQ